MRIRKLAEQAGVSVDTLRFYEKKGLLDQRHIQRSENGYRDYTDSAIEHVAIIRHAQAAGFRLSEIRYLLGLWQREQLTHELVISYLHDKQRQIAGKIAELEQIQGYLADKIRHLEGELRRDGASSRTS